MSEKLFASPTWGLVTDPRVWLVIGASALLMLGRAGLVRASWLDLLKPWRTDRARRGTSAPGLAPRSRLLDPFFVFLLVISSTAVAAWVVMRMTVTAARP